MGCWAMEWVLAVPDIKRLNIIVEKSNTHVLDQLKEVKEKFKNHLGNIAINRLYFGQEFCERALNNPREVEKAFEIAQAQEMEFTLLTPYVTDKRLRDLVRILDIVYQAQKDSEVVVNDWGVLLLLTEDYPDVKPVLGRQLLKMLRDPRITELSPDKLQAMRSILPTTNLSGSYLKRLLEKYGVTRVELDYPPQGLSPEIKNWGYSLSLYLPYVTITSGRMCMPGSWGLNPSEKFNGASEQCTKACKTTWFELSDKSRRILKAKNGEILQKGNTMFYRLKKEALENAIQVVKEGGIDRVIFQPEPL